MRRLFLALLPALALACGGSERTTTEQAAPAPPPPPPAAPPAAVRENASFIGGIVRSMELLDDVRFVVTLEVRTALPASPGTESLVEPGQTLQVLPLYDEGPGGVIDLQLERNRRLHDVRKVPVGGPVIGRVQVRQDGVWYLLDTTMGPD